MALTSHRSDRSVRRHAAALIVAGPFVLSACGGETRPVDVVESSDTEGPRESDAAPFEAATDDGGSDTTSSAQDALLTVADLPEGWSEVDSVGGDTGNCLDDLTGDESPFGGSNAATASFKGGDLGPFLVASVTPVPAEEALPALDDLVVACDGARSPEGLTTTLEVVAIDGVPAGSLTVRGAQEDPAGGSVQFAIAATGGADGSAFVLALSPIEEVGEDLVAQSLVTMADRLANS